MRRILILILCVLLWTGANVYAEEFVDGIPPAPSLVPLDADFTSNGLMTRTGAGTYGITGSLSALNTLLSVTLLDDGAIADSTAIGLNNGSTHSTFGVAGDDSINEMFTAIDTGIGLKLTTSGAAAAIHMDDILTTLGVSEEATHMGTFTGSTISDSVTTKAAIQALETSVETKQASHALLTSLASLTLTDGDMVNASSSTAVEVIQAGTNNYFLKGQGAGAPIWANGIVYPILTGEPTDEVVGGFYAFDNDTFDPASYEDTNDYLTICTAAGATGTFEIIMDLVTGERFFDAIDLSGGGTLTLDANEISSVDIATIVVSSYWGAAGITVDETQCTVPALVTLNSGPKQYTISCADHASSVMYGTMGMPDSWDGGTVTFEIQVYHATTENITFAGDFSAQCHASGEVVDNSWTGTPVSADVSITTEYKIEHATTAAVTPAGTCAGGDTLWWKWAMDDGTTDANAANTDVLGVKMEWTSNVGD